MSNISLWKASDEYFQLCEELYNSADENGVVDAEIFENMIAAKETFEGKAVACAMVHRQLEKDIADVDIELDRLNRIKESLKSKKESLAKNLADACIKTGTESIKGIYANISFRNNPPKVVIDDEKAIPYDYIREKITYEADKKRIKEAIQRGEIVSGAHIESTRSIQIK